MNKSKLENGEDKTVEKMKIKITMILDVPETFYISAFIGALQGYFNNLKVLDWKWSKVKRKL